MTTTSRGARTPTGAESAPPRRSHPVARAGEGGGGRLLFVSGGLSPRGGGIAAAGRLLLAATREWAAARGVALRVLSLGAAGELPADVDGEGFGGRRGALARAVWRAQFLEGYRHQVYDFLGVARIQGVLPRRLRARYLLYLHGIECWGRLRGGRRAALAAARVRLANSGWTVSRLRQANPWCDHVRTLPLAVGDSAAADGADQALLERLGSGYVLIVGRLAASERYKGHEDLIAAMAGLAAAHPTVRLVVAGEGEDRARLEARARALGVEARARFTGFVDEATLRALYDRCAIFAMPSTGEGFGLVYLEAMRAGKPCVALASSAAAEIVVDGGTGVLVEPGVQPLTEALAGLLDDPARAAALGAAGRTRWLREFAPDVFAGRLAAHLDSLLAGSEPRLAAADSSAPMTTAPCGVASGLGPARSTTLES